MKAALTKKMQLRVWGYLEGEYQYLLIECGNKSYDISKKRDIVT